jgi:hypothetical protein
VEEAAVEELRLLPKRRTDPNEALG